MRLYHYQLIPYLPRRQLLSQWRECVCIANSIHDKETPNHILVNKIMDYPISEFCDYCNIVLVEMLRRGYKVNESSINKLEKYVRFEIDSDKQFSKPFSNWHNARYLYQNFYNLEEKYDCGGISDDEWKTFRESFEKICNQIKFEPIIHAHWITLFSTDKCSNCGYETGKSGWTTKRCPECGAHMDEM